MPIKYQKFDAAEFSFMQQILMQQNFFNAAEF